MIGKMADEQQGVGASGVTNYSSTTSPADPVPNVTSQAYSGPVYGTRRSVWGKINSIFGGITALVVIISIVLCLIKAPSEKDSYLLLSNIAMTSFLCIANVYWYWRDKLVEEKVWFLYIIYIVILLQCVTTDVFIFYKAEDPISHSTTTPVTSTTSSHSTARTTRPLTTTHHP